MKKHEKFTRMQRFTQLATFGPHRQANIVLIGTVTAL